jgi:hypothetical protein
LKAQSHVVLVVVAVLVVEPLVVEAVDPLVVVATLPEEVVVEVPPSLPVLSDEPLEQAIGASAIAPTETLATKIHPMRNF